MKKEQNLKYSQVPWVFIQPTRIQKVRIPKRRKRNDVRAFHEAGAPELAFLGQYNVGFSDDDIAILQRSIQNDSSNLEEDKLVGLNHGYSESQESLSLGQLYPIDIPQTEKSSEHSSDDNENDEDFELCSARQDEKENDLMSPIEETLERKSTAKSETTVHIPAVSETLRESITEQVIQPNLEPQKQFVMKTYQIKDDNTAEETYNPGRKKLLDALQNARPRIIEPSTSNPNLIERSRNVKLALKKSKGAALFRDYLQREHQALPDSLKEIS